VIAMINSSEYPNAILHFRDTGTNPETSP